MIRNCPRSSILIGLRMTATFLRALGSASVSGSLTSAIDLGVGS